MTFSAPLTMKVAFINERPVRFVSSPCLGDFPMMTRSRHLHHSRYWRVVVTQLVRSPGAYIMEPKQAEREKQVLVANLMPQRGSCWSSRSTRRARLTCASTASAVPGYGAAAAMGYGSNDELVDLFDAHLHQEHHRA